MIDLAVGVIIGAAFGKILDSLVKVIIMPLVAFVVGGEVDFPNQFWVLRAPENLSGPENSDALPPAGAVEVSADEGSVGKECDRPGRTRWLTEHVKKSQSKKTKKN